MSELQNEYYVIVRHTTLQEISKKPNPRKNPNRKRGEKDE